MRIEKPKVSIVMPVFNGVRFIGEALLSIQQQTFKDFEVIIVDDGSTDSTCNIVADFVEEDERFHLVKNSKNLGIGATRNVGVKHSKGTFVTFLSDDDVWKPNFLEEMLKVSDKGIVFCDYKIINEGKNVLKGFSPFPEYHEPHIFPISYFHNLVKEWVNKKDLFINYSGILGKKEYFTEKFKFNEGLRYSEDAYHAIKASKKLPFVYLPKSLVGWRFYKNKVSNKDLNLRISNHDKVLSLLRTEGYDLRVEQEFPKVLVAAPTSIRHAYYIDTWAKSIREWDYPVERIEVVVVDNTPFEYDRNEEFYAHLKNLGLRVVRYPWNRKQDVTQMLATCREIYRQIAYFERFDYIFHLDTDTTIGKKGLKTLISRDKDQIGLPVHVFPKSAGYQPPCVFKRLGFSTKGLFYYTFPELHRIKEKLRKAHKSLVYKVAAAPLGVLLVKRKVFEKVPFTSHVGLRMGEDVWYHNNASEKGFEFWIDFTVKVKHRNTDWDMAQMKGATAQRLWVGFGPENAKNIEVLDHARKRRTIIKTK